MENIESTSNADDVAVKYLTENKLHKIIEECNSCKDYTKLTETLEDVYSNIRSLSRSFRKTANTSIDANKMHTGLDYPSLSRAYTELFKLPRYIFMRPMAEALISLASNLEVGLQSQSENLYSDDEITDALLVVFEIPTLGSGSFLKSGFPEICKAATCITIDVQAKLARVWADQGASSLRTILENLQSLVTNSVRKTMLSDVYLPQNCEVTAAANIIRIVYYANILAGTLESPQLNQEDSHLGRKLYQNVDELAAKLDIDVLDCRKPMLPFTEFCNTALNEIFNSYEKLSEVTNKDSMLFRFMQYPFMLTPDMKSLFLYYNNRARMKLERVSLIKLQVRRKHVLEDTLKFMNVVINMKSGDILKKELILEFINERAFDRNGVSREYFQMVFEEIFDYYSGLFTIENDSQTFWFNHTSPGDVSKFTAVGMVLGLAIYNSVLISANFPVVFYRKLMGKAGCFEDMKECNPIIYNSLKHLLEYTEDDLEDVFMLTFRVNYKDMFGTLLYHDLIKDGDETMVTQSNKHEFVRLYADFLLNTSVKKQFEAFYEGFHTVVNERPFYQLFRPEELELQICGRKNFDFKDLERTTRYEGYTRSTPVIVNFWSVVHEFSYDQQRTFLQFTMGSDRVPIGGLNRLNMLISRYESDSSHLPTSNTCANMLNLPEYESAEILKVRLLTALLHSRGFGFT